MALTDQTVRGIRSPIPSGFIVGRTDPGTGAAQLIDINTLAQQIAATGQVATPAGAANLPAIGSGDVLGNSTASTAGATDTTLTAIIDRALGSAQGDILYRDASAWKVLAPGTSGNFLKTQGAGANPVWAAAGGGSSALTLISTLTASNSASLSWTGLSQATSWKLVGRLLVPVTNNTGLGINFGTGGGPTYITTGYEFGFGTVSSSNTAADFGAENQGVAPADDGTTANSSPGTSFDLTIYTDNANFICVSGTCVFKTQSTHWKAEFVGTVVATSAAITAIKLSFGSGNINTGNVSLYSLAS